MPARVAAREPNLEGLVATLGQVPGSEAATQAVQDAMKVAHEAGARVTAALLVDADPVAAILETARDHRVDAIVLGGRAPRPPRRARRAPRRGLRGAERGRGRRDRPDRGGLNDGP